MFLLLLLWPSLWMDQATLESLPIEMTAFLQGQIFALAALFMVGLILNVRCVLRPFWTRTTLLINASLSGLTTVIMIYLGTGADLLSATGHTLPAQLTLDALNRRVSHSVIVVGLFTVYETFRDLWRWRKLGAVSSGDPTRD